MVRYNVFTMRTILTLLIAVITISLKAQLLERRPVTIGGGLEVGVPIGEFNDSYGKEIFGLAGNFTVPMGLLPFDWGFDFGWGRMGAESQEVPIAEEHLDATTGDLRVNSDIYRRHAGRKTVHDEDTGQGGRHGPAIHGTAEHERVHLEPWLGGWHSIHTRQNVLCGTTRRTAGWRPGAVRGSIHHHRF
jgi:hypothetical protein